MQLALGIVSLARSFSLSRSPRYTALRPVHVDLVVIIVYACQTLSDYRGICTVGVYTLSDYVKS